MDDFDTVPHGTISPNSSDIYTIGVNLPNQTNAKGKQYAFGEGEIDRASDAYALEFARGNFIEYRDEHSPDKPIGEIIMLWRNQNGDMGCLGHISDKSNAGRVAINNAVLQFSGGMSAGLTTGVVKDSSMFIPVEKPVYRQLTEISITSDPCFAGTTHIKYVSDDPTDVLEKVARLAAPNGTSDPSRSIARLPAAFQSLPQVFADASRQGRRFALPDPNQGYSLNSLSQSIGNSRSAVSMMSTFFSQLAHNQKHAQGGTFGAALAPFFVADSPGAHFSPQHANFGASHNYGSRGGNNNGNLANKRSLRVVKTRFSKDVPDSIGPPEPEDLDTFRQYYDNLVNDSNIMSAADPSVGTSPSDAQAAQQQQQPPVAAAPSPAAGQVQAPIPTQLQHIPQGVTVSVTNPTAAGAAAGLQTPPLAPAPIANAGAPGTLPAGAGQAPAAAGQPSQQQAQRTPISKEAIVNALGGMKPEDLDLTMASAEFLKKQGVTSGKDVVDLMVRVKRMEELEGKLLAQQKEAEAAKLKAEEDKKMRDANEMRAGIARTMYEPYAKMDLSASKIPKEKLDHVMAIASGKITDRLINDLDLQQVSEVTTMARAFDEDQRSKENLQQQQVQWAFGRSAMAQNFDQAYQSALGSMGAANVSSPQQSVPQQQQQQQSAQFTQPPPQQSQQQQQYSGSMAPPVAQFDQQYAQQQQQQHFSQPDALAIQRIKTVASAIPDINSGSVEACMKFISMIGADSIPIGSMSFLGVNPFIEQSEPALPAFANGYGDNMVNL
jgi:hypothetical protein